MRVHGLRLRGVIQLSHGLTARRTLHPQAIRSVPNRPKSASIRACKWTLIAQCPFSSWAWLCSSSDTSYYHLRKPRLLLPWKTTVERWFVSRKSRRATGCRRDPNDVAGGLAGDWQLHRRACSESALPACRNGLNKRLRGWAHFGVGSSGTGNFEVGLARVEIASEGCRASRPHQRPYPASGPALTLPALIYGSITGEGVEVGPATTDGADKSAAGRAPGVPVAFPPKRDSGGSTTTISRRTVRPTDGARAWPWCSNGLGRVTHGL